MDAGESFPKQIGWNDCTKEQGPQPLGQTHPREPFVPGKDGDWMARRQVVLVVEGRFKDEAVCVTAVQFFLTVPDWGAG
jgi:hypothetical protein